MSAALGVYQQGSGAGVSAYGADDGDNGHIGEWAFDDGLPGGDEFYDSEEELEVGSAPTVVACVRWADGKYCVKPLGSRGAEEDPAEPVVDPVGEPPMNGDAIGDPSWPLVMRLRGCESRPALDDASVMDLARADTFFIQPVLSPAQCAEIVAEMDAVAQRVGWFDDGTGVKFQTNLPGCDVEGELFSASVRAAVGSAILGQALPLTRKLFGGGAALTVRGSSGALIKYGSAQLEEGGHSYSPEEAIERSLLQSSCAAEVVGGAELVSSVVGDAEWRLIAAQSVATQINPDHNWIPSDDSEQIVWVFSRGSRCTATATLASQSTSSSA